MKRFWLVMLSLGLVLAFSASAMAVDVKFSGSFYAAGIYQDKTTFRSTYEEQGLHVLAGNNSYLYFDGYDSSNGSVGPSTAFYYQRLRVQTDFIVSPGLKLVTRFDALERIWGGVRSSSEAPFSLFGDSAGTRSENENIAFDWAYVEYASPIGVFTVGYQPDGGWGTVFADNEVNGVPVGKIGWALKKGAFTGRVQVAKILDLSNSAVFNELDATDNDIDKYSADIKYAWNGGEAGFRGFYERIAALRTIADHKINVYGVIPYAKAKIGPVALQAEVDYYWGKMEAELPGESDMKLRNLGVFLDAVADFKMFYAGGTFAYISGDNPSTPDKYEGGIFLTGGNDWNPCLIMFNYDRTNWVGSIPGYYGSVANSSAMNNAWFYQGKVGVRPIPALDIMGSVAYAKADKIDTFYESASKSYGWEIDVTATYKITNNLSYMLGGAYLFTGDYYKGAPGQADDVENNFLLINKLTLTF